jgi:hemolysin activation/secretion protein
VIRARQQTLNLTLAFDAIEINTDTNLGSSSGETRASYDSLRIFRLGTNYAIFDTLLGDTRGANNQASILVSQGVTGLGSGHDGDTSTPPPRIGEKVDFTKASGTLSRTQTLFEPYEGASVALQEAVGWQATGDILPPVEKFYLGGPHFNRGYYYGQVAGDSAVTTSTELQLNTPIPMPPKVPVPISAQFYTFWDWGDAWQNTKAESDVVLNSLGAGVRFYVGEQTEVDFEGAYRGNTYPNGSGPNVSALRSAAFYWQVSFRF